MLFGAEVDNAGGNSPDAVSTLGQNDLSAQARLIRA
jgi:hypothetical protein